MKLVTSVLSILMIAGLNGCMRTSPFDRAALAPGGVVPAAVVESGVVPEGTWLVVKASDNVNTRRAYKSTLYGATIAENVVARNERVLIPKESPVELGVSSLSYLGPGGAGMSELALEVRSVTVNGMSYPVTTIGEPNAGGLGVDRYIAKIVGGDEEASNVRTSGRHINVPAGTLLAFQLQDPIRLSTGRQ